MCDPRVALLQARDGGLETVAYFAPPAVTIASWVVLQKVPSEANPKVRNHGEGPSRGLLRDYEPSDAIRSLVSPLHPGRAVPW